MSTFWDLAFLGLLILDFVFFWMAVYEACVSHRFDAAGFEIGMAIWFKLARREISK